ncbi:MAG: hypothetical protein FWG50_03195 [Kiritimatiellaeota bacterium]|nr:hypothetical protein [Kiritimatiellota bacterium]
MDMKSMGLCVCVTTLCLTASRLSASLNLTVKDWKDYQSILLSQKIKGLEEDFKDAGKLKAYLKDFFMEWYPYDNFALDFKRGIPVSDEVMRDALTGLLRESAAKVGWDRFNTLLGDSLEDSDARRMMCHALGWMCACTDGDTKKLLRDVAMDSAKDTAYRGSAVIAYLRRADAQDAQDFLAALLADEARLPADHGKKIRFAIERMLKETKVEGPKREAIDAALNTMKAREPKE